MEYMRTKGIHRQGTIGHVNWVSTGDHPYTGIFADGATEAFLRYSQTNNLYEGSSGLQPSLALKVLLDGKNSINIVALSDKIASDSWNFFEKPMSNRMHAFGLETIEAQTVQKK